MTIPDITDLEWLRIRSHFGDLVYEHPEMHHMMLELLDTTDIEGAVEKAPKALRAEIVATATPSRRLS